jgi:integral membrane protein
MENFIKTPLGRFRLIGLLEGISFLVLLGIAMPLKYKLGLPLAVKYVGWAHGLLFILFIVALAQVAFTYRWSIVKVILAFVASLVPFGTFILDAKLLKPMEVTLKSDQL